MALNFGSDFLGEEKEDTFLNSKYNYWSCSGNKFLPYNNWIDGLHKISYGNGDIGLIDNLDLYVDVDLPHNCEIIECIVYGNAAATDSSWVLLRGNATETGAVAIATANVGTSAKISQDYQITDNSKYSHIIKVQSLLSNDMIYGAVILYSIEVKK
jgi:hypothetical protein